MKRCVIAIDCDDVLINASQYVIDTYNLLYGTRVLPEHAHQSNVDEWQAEREEVLRRIGDIQCSEEYATIEPSAEARHAVAHLAKQHELHLVSARPPEVLTVTHAMLESHYPGCFTSIEHVGPDRSKGEVCQALRADVLIDDNARHLIDAQAHGVPVAIWFGPYPWQNSQEAGLGVDRCVDWPETVERIEKYARGHV